MCGLTSNLELVAHEFKNHFMVKKAEIVSLRPEHGWHVELDHRYVKSLLDAMAMTHCKSMFTPRKKGHENSHVETEKLDPKEHREFRAGAGICQYMTEQRFDIAFSTKEIIERGSRTDHSLKDKIEENRALPQRTPAMCTELPLGGEAGRRHPCDWAGDIKTRCSTSGGVFAVGPCFTVRHWSVTQATVSLSSAESEAKAITKGCIESLNVKHLLEHQTVQN